MARPAPHSRRTVLRSAAAAAAAVPLAAAAGTANAQASPRSSAAYYVDADRGDDTSDGTAPARAWRTLERASQARLGPGDALLLRAGCRWTGQLALQQPAGSAPHPARVGRYGDGARPRIDAAGAHDSAVLLDNPRFTVLEELEATNTAGDGSPRNGVRVHAHDVGAVPGVTVRRMLIHDVDGTGGQRVGAAGLLVHITGTGTPTWFQDLLLEENEVHHVRSYGIITWSSWMRRNNRNDFYPTETGITEVGPWTPSRGTVVRGNRVEEVTGGGIAQFHSAAALVERNTVHRAVRGRTVPNGGNVAIWWEGVDDIVVQRNTVSETGFNGPGTDGQAFDADADSHGSVVQDNVSRHNDGGFFITVSFGQVPTGNTVVRRNLSVGDGYQTFGISTATSGTYLRDNTIRVEDRTVVVEPPLNGAGSYPMDRVVKVYANAQDVEFTGNRVENASDAGYDTENGNGETVVVYRDNHLG